ncbi:MAG: ASKHA domain-containing protein [Candidatus Aureabacteria bacterium]|nr:ASKHA domain-containing protein [Candidatus Auribacterota bacterium]
MTRYKIIFLPAGKTAEVEEGETLLQAAEKASVPVRSDCGGDGTCGKCRLRVVNGKAPSSPSSLLSDDDRKKGWVLACRTPVRSDITVEVPPESRREKKHREETSRRFRDWSEETIPLKEIDPLVRKFSLSLPPPSLSDNLGDRERLVREIRKATRAKVVEVPLPVLRALAAVLRSNSWEVVATVARKESSLEILAVEGKATAKKAYGAAIDIGTTTVVVHLVDLAAGKTVAAEAEFNSQIAFGEDVIKRIIRCEEAGVTKLAAVPSVPAREAGLMIAAGALLYSVPGIASWVGGDITAGVLHSGMHRSEDLALLVDIGTNGEIAVGNSEWLLACSCSAGPAFEGSGIACGTRAGAGAIDRFDFANDRSPTFRTIREEKPTGICGSGLIDLLSELFRTGHLGRDGRLNPSSDTKRIRMGEAGLEFVVAKAGESGGGRDIVLTQADIDNLIRAKAAVYAGISVLLKAVNLAPSDLKRLYISGGFGNYLNIRRAICLGLLPDLPPERIVFIGNGSVRGAKRILLSRRAESEAREIAKMMTYFELSADNRFMEEFAAAMFLPHTNVELFPSCKK